MMIKICKFFSFRDYNTPRYLVISSQLVLSEWHFCYATTTCSNRCSRVHRQRRGSRNVGSPANPPSFPVQRFPDWHWRGVTFLFSSFLLSPRSSTRKYPPLSYLHPEFLNGYENVKRRVSLRRILKKYTVESLAFNRIQLCYTYNYRLIKTCKRE